MLDRFTREKLVVVEGKDDRRFISAMNKHLGFPDIDIQETEGVNNIRNQLAAIKITPGFRNVKSLGIVRDANEKGFMSAWRSVCYALRKEGFQVPSQHLVPTSADHPKTVVLILPDGKNKGKLETNILQSINNDSAMNCVNSFFICLDNSLKKSDMPKDIQKAKLQAFLATKKKYCHDLGEAATAGVWQFNDVAFKPIERLLKTL